jgi:transcriptional regulator with XRE-family HTH domain
MVRLIMALTTGPQLRAARALVRMEQERLAELASVAANTVRRIEAMDGPISANVTTIRRIERALEATGVEFIPGGARLRESADA